MRTAKVADSLSYHFTGDEKDQFVNTGVLYCQAIENADGVPFRLIFGPETGCGYYLNVGNGIRQLLGVSPEDLTEKAFLGMIEKIVPLADDIPSEFSEWRKKFISGELKNYKAEILIRMPGGETKWIQDSSLPLIDEETGKVIGAFGILFDINERKQFLDQFKKVKEKAEDCDRLQSAFLHNISHEIRTPLNAIVGYSTLLCDIEDSTDKQKEFMDIIFRSTDHLLEIIDDIVEISNLEANTVKIKKDVVNVSSILRKVYERFRIKAIEKNVTLRFAESPGCSEVSILTDSFKLSQILRNLINNAMKFTEKGEIEFGYRINNNKIEFHVSDTGIGIPIQDQPMIFSRFYQAESSITRRFEGTGLGLSISKAYIELLGGEIWFTSQPGKGSVFNFTLPFEKV